MPPFSEQMVNFVQEPECGANQMQILKNQRVLIFDSGAGTTDLTILEKGEKDTVLDPQSYSCAHGGADIDSFLLDKYLKMFSADVRILVRPVIQAALKLLNARTEALSDPDRKFDLFDSATLLKLKEKFET